MNKIKGIISLFNPKQNRKEALQAVSAAVALVVVTFAGYAVAQSAFNTTLSVTVNTALTFTQSSTNNFSSINPGTPQFATSTLVVATNDVNGWRVTLSGDNKTASANNLQSGSNSITDQTEWVNGAATTTAGNAVRLASLANSGNVLAYRVMTASSTNGTPFVSTAWWGTTDAYTDSATTLWAGISSSTVQRQIGNAGAGSYSASPHVNSVVYYLNVSATQPTGAYSAPLTYTATGN